MDLKELLRTDAQPGRVTWIGLRSKRYADMDVVESAEVTGVGLAGDHARAVIRGITLIQEEHLAVIGAMLGQGPVSPLDLRRNICVAGINLASLRKGEVQIGTAILKINGPCAPCSRMQKNLGPGGYNAVRGHGGWYAEVVQTGAVALGDTVLRV